MPPRKQKTSLPASVFHMPGAQDHPGKPDALDIPERRGATHEGVPAAAAHVLRIGPAGLSYPDWGGYVYPSRRPHGFHEAAYLSEFFDTIEINTSFYQPLKPETAKQWVDLVSGNRNFVFTAKLWQRFTHDVAFTTGGSATEDERAVRAGFDVLRAAGKLGAVLLQFPFSFHRTKETMAYLSAVLLRFRDYPLVVEVRHDTWNAPETLALLHEHGAGICNIDQPIIDRKSTRLNSSHEWISYAVFCLKKKKREQTTRHHSYRNEWSVEDNEGFKRLRGARAPDWHTKRHTR